MKTYVHKTVTTTKTTLAQQSFIYNGQKFETTQMSIKREMIK